MKKIKPKELRQGGIVKIVKQGIPFYYTFPPSEEDIAQGIEEILEEYKGNTSSIEKVTVALFTQGEIEKVRYVVSHEKFHRIRRITGYLVGGLHRFNRAKEKEEGERVKHWT